MTTEPGLRKRWPVLSKSRPAPWFKSSLGSSLFALLTTGHLPTAEETAAPRIDKLRQSMLELIAGLRDGRSIQLARRIRFATDVQSLWFFRADLMVVLAGAIGETAARQKVDALSTLCADLLPKGLRSRASGLSAIAPERTVQRRITGTSSFRPRA